MEIPGSFRSQMNEQLNQEAALFFECLAGPSPVSIRSNVLKGRFIPENATAIPWSSSGYTLTSRPSFTLDPMLHAGAYYVQEASSMFLEQAVRSAVNLSLPLVALDLCAAPGGKSTHLLSLLSPESVVVSNEVIKARANILAENVIKWGATNSIVTNNDPQTFSTLTGMFDLILVDAPCSGEGLFRKDPQAMIEWSPENVGLCALRQRRILADVWPALKEGGILIYSTCTYNRTENEENIQWLRDNKAVEFISIPLDSNWGVEEVMDNGVVGYRFYPHRVNGEGFFISVIRKLEISGQTHSRIGTNIKKVKDSEPFQAWVKDAHRYVFFERPEGVRIFPEGQFTNMLQLAQRLFILEAGTQIGEWKHNKFIPAHPLAVSLSCKFSVDSIELDLEEALKFLRKETFQLEIPKGYHLVKYKGVGLGWINSLGTRLNNLYPMHWRIRM